MTACQCRGKDRLTSHGLFRLVLLEDSEKEGVLVVPGRVVEERARLLVREGVVADLLETCLSAQRPQLGTPLPGQLK